jgi:hypothetical protein
MVLTGRYPRPTISPAPGRKCNQPRNSPVNLLCRDAYRSDDIVSDFLARRRF